MRKKPVLFHFGFLWFCWVLCLFSTASGATGENRNALAKMPEVPEKMTVEQAIDHLSMKLNARIIVFGLLEEQTVIPIHRNRPALDQLKSVLKGNSYAIIYNDPMPSFDRFENSQIVTRITPAHKHAPVSMIQDQTHLIEDPQERLVRKIKVLEAEIENGVADKFYERWSRIKDPKYIFNHRKEVERLKKRLSGMD